MQSQHEISKLKNNESDEDSPPRKKITLLNSEANFDLEMEVDDQDVSDNFVLQIELLEQENTKLKTIN